MFDLNSGCGIKTDICDNSFADVKMKSKLNHRINDSWKSISNTTGFFIWTFEYFLQACQIIETELHYEHVIENGHFDN